MIRDYEISHEAFLDLATGSASPSTMDMLRSAQVSKHMLLIRLIGAHQAYPGWEDGLAVFEQAQMSPSAVRILADPWTGTWAAQCVRQLNHTGALAVTEAAHFNALAAVVAIGLGLDADLTVPIRDGWVYLPTLGAIHVDSDGETHQLRVSKGRATYIPDDPAADTPTWQGHRTLTSTGRHTAVQTILDDLSPYRHSFRLALTGRTGASDLSSWQRLWTEAWELLRQRVPARAAELLLYLNTAVPLSKEAGRAGFSATSRDAFGALALSHPANGVNLALTLVHEGQHAKLGALLDLVDLFESSSNTYFAPWRDDPRPIGGLMQGTYAFLGIADTWRQLSADPSLEKVALRQFAHIREQVAVAAAALEVARELNDAGRVFVAGMQASLNGLLAIDLPDDIVREARMSVYRRFAAWCQANADVHVRQ